MSDIINRKRRLFKIFLLALSTASAAAAATTVTSVIEDCTFFPHESYFFFHPQLNSISYPNFLT